MKPDFSVLALLAALPLPVSNPPPPSALPLSIREEIPSKISRVGQRLAALPRPALIGLTFGVLAGVGMVDYITGYEFSMLILYLLPVSLAVWFVGRRFATLISLLSVGVGIVADAGAGATYANKAVLAWNAIIIFGFFLVVVVLLHSLRAMLLDLESRVRQRTAALTEEMAERDRLEREVLEISEREQRRIGHDLHDGLGQHLTATALAGQVLEDHLAARQLAPEASKAERIVELIEQSIELTRNLARGLSPVSVETEGLPTALAELAATTIAQFYLPCELRCPRHLPSLDPAAAMHLYRITQESISNAIRHGRASRVEIELTVEERSKHLLLTICDNGKGLPPMQDRRVGGQGLRIMAHRARMIDATLKISSRPQGGTTVQCALDLPAAGDAASLAG